MCRGFSTAVLRIERLRFRGLQSYGIHLLRSDYCSVFQRASRYWFHSL